MRLLVVGGGGQLGRALAHRARERGDQVTVGYLGRPLAGFESVPLDKTRPELVARVIRDANPDVVVDAGALHNVDYCEAHPEQAELVNSVGSESVARAAAGAGARALFVSTDFVFGDLGKPPHSETDPTEPLSAYGQSKLGGERAVIAVDPGNCVIRPSVIYSWTPLDSRLTSGSRKALNFGTWLIEEISAGRHVRIVTDQRGSPTLADDLAGAALAVIDKGVGGVYHTAGSTATSRFDFAVALVRAAGLDVGLVEPVTSDALAQRARRPRDSSLSSEKLAAATGYRTAPLAKQVEEFASAFSEDRGGRR